MYMCCDHLRRNAANFPQKTAVVSEAETATYKELNDMVDAMAAGFLKMGLRKGDRIAVLLHNSVKTVAAILAGFRIGAPVLAMNYRWNMNYIDELFEKHNVKLAIFNLACKEKIVEIKRIRQGTLADSTPLFICYADGGETDGFESIEMLLTDNVADHRGSFGPEDNDMAYVIFTSGSTGKPKAVPRTHGQLLEFGKMCSDDSEKLVAFTFAPLFHLSGFGYMLRALMTGGTFVTLNKYNMAAIVEMIEKHSPTTMFLLPPVLYEGLGKMSEPERKYTSVETVELGGGNVSSATLESIYDKMPNARLLMKYGQSETWLATSSAITREELEKYPEIRMTIGRCACNCQLRLITAEGSDAENMQVGELYVKSPLVFHGYLDDNDLDKNVLHADGWCRTQDLMYRDANGYYYFMGRTRDMIKTGGENVYAREVEQALLEYGPIQEVAVFGVPDPQWGEAIAAAVVLKPGCRLNPDEMIADFRTRKEGYKKPRYIAVLEELPTNDTGKVQKKELTDNWSKICVKI